MYLLKGIGYIPVDHSETTLVVLAVKHGYVIPDALLEVKYCVYKYNSYFYIEKLTFKIMCEVCYRAKRDKKEATWF